MRRAAPPSRKKAKKVEKKIGHARKRAAGEAAGVGEMKDGAADFDGGEGGGKGEKAVEEGKGGEMEVDGME